MKIRFHLAHLEVSSGAFYALVAALLSIFADNCITQLVICHEKSVQYLCSPATANDVLVRFGSFIEDA